MGPMGQYGSNLAQYKPIIQYWPDLPILEYPPDCFHTGVHYILCLFQFNITVPRFTRNISAQFSRAISQKSLLSRCLAIQFKFLNKFNTNKLNIYKLYINKLYVNKYYLKNIYIKEISRSGRRNKNYNIYLKSKIPNKNSGYK